MVMYREIGLILLCLVLLAIESGSLPSKHGPGHHKGLYGITRKHEAKAVLKGTNKPVNESLTKDSSLNATVKGRTNEKTNVLKNQKRSATFDFLKGSNIKRSRFAGEDGPTKREVSVKEVKVGYKKSLKENNPENATQVIKITGNFTATEQSLNDTALENMNASNELEDARKDPRSTNTNIFTDLKVPQMGADNNGAVESTNGSASINLGGNDTESSFNNSQADSRTPSSNIITDLKVPKMGEYIHGMGPSSNISENDTSQNKQQTSMQVSGPSGNGNLRSPQVPNLGASIVGIVDNSNGSQLNNRETLAANQTDGNDTTAGEGKKSEGCVDVKLKNFLDTLDDIANTTAETAKLVKNTTTELKAAFLQNEGYNATTLASNSSVNAGKDVNAKKKHEIVGPHYYEPECDDKKKCPDGHYCRMYVCVECHRSKHACTHREQCCNKMECIYGRCEDKPKGSPGAFCDKDSECAGEACCVLEPTIDEEYSICKPKLSEYHQCSPILFRKIWIGDHKPDCGPCKGGLKCVQRGVEGSHEVCMKKP